MSEPVSRNHLPIPDRPFVGDVPLDASDPAAKFPPIEPLRMQIDIAEAAEDNDHLITPEERLRVAMARQ